MGVHRQFLAGLKVKIDDFKVGRVVHQQLFHGFVAKFPGLIKIDLFHNLSFSLLILGLTRAYSGSSAQWMQLTGQASTAS